MDATPRDLVVAPAVAAREAVPGPIASPGALRRGLADASRRNPRRDRFTSMTSGRPWVRSWLDT
jgi:hypothetical protein